MVQVGIIGAAGYVGGELLRLLLRHPDIGVLRAYSASQRGRPVGAVHPNLRGHSELTFADPADADTDDVLLLAVPHGAAAEIAASRTAGCLIDLTADFRLRDPAVYARYYGAAHPAPHLLDQFTTGWPERYRSELATADRISVPGCMATAAMLALAPLADGGLVRPEVTVDAKIGSSGSGTTATAINLHAERSGAMRVFAPHRHRHEAEVAQATGLRVRMAATGVEAVRGVQVLCHGLAEAGVEEGDLRRAYRDTYRKEPFVHLVAQRRGLYRLPEPKILLGTNQCDVGFSLDRESRRLVAVAALDNLVKGGAGNAVQCLNIRMGWPERAGLDLIGLHPI